MYFNFSCFLFTYFVFTCLLFPHYRFVFLQASIPLLRPEGSSNAASMKKLDAEIKVVYSSYHIIFYSLLFLSSFEYVTSFF